MQIKDVCHFPDQPGRVYSQCEPKLMIQRDEKKKLNNWLHTSWLGNTNDQNKGKVEAPVIDHFSYFGADGEE